MMKIGSLHNFFIFFKNVFQRVFALTENSVFEQKSSFWSLKKLRQLPTLVDKKLERRGIVFGTVDSLKNLSSD